MVARLTIAEEAKASSNIGFEDIINRFIYEIPALSCKKHHA